MQMGAVSLSMVESMACEKIVVVSNTDGIPAVIKDNQNGFLVNKDDEVAIRKQIRWINRILSVFVLSK